MELIFKILIYIHAFSGGVGLLTGLISIFSKKGSAIHKRMGKLFSVGMFVSSLVSLPVAWMPNHENLFLFLIGVFTIYLVLTGNRALKFKSNLGVNTKYDRWISGMMMLVSFIMVFLGVNGLLVGGSLNLLYLFFGLIGLFLSNRDFRFYKNYRTNKNNWLKNHIGKIVGAFIASVTAFIVAGLGMSNLISWILPSVIGTVYISYSIRSFKLK